MNISIGGTLTHFAAPPVLMVARPWEWDTVFMFGHFGWRAALAIVVSTLAYYPCSDANSQRSPRVSPCADVDAGRPEAAALGQRLLPIPWWVTAVYVLFIVWTVVERALSGAVPGGFSVLPRLRSRDGGLLDAV